MINLIAEYTKVIAILEQWKYDIKNSMHNHFMEFLYKQQNNLDENYMRIPDYDKALKGFVDCLVRGAHVCEFGESQGYSISIQLLKRLGITKKDGRSKIMNELNGALPNPKSGLYTLQGWQCPICKTVYSPFINKCDNCVPYYETYDSTTGTGGTE